MRLFASISADLDLTRLCSFLSLEGIPRVVMETPMPLRPLFLVHYCGSGLDLQIFRPTGYQCKAKSYLKKLCNWRSPCGSQYGRSLKVPGLKIRSPEISSRAYGLLDNSPFCYLSPKVNASRMQSRADLFLVYLLSCHSI